MSRVKAGVITKTRHKKIIKRAKGYYGRRKNTFKAANQAVEKVGQTMAKEWSDKAGSRGAAVLSAYK